MKFPKNPSNNAIATINGMRYQFDAISHSWNRVEGVIGVASLNTPGLMTPTELAKLNRLVVPPPRTTIKGQGCPAPYVGGTITMTGVDDFVIIRGDVDIHYGDEVETYEFRIHENTSGFNFELDAGALLEELITRGQARYVAPAGDRGPKGFRGEDGIGELPVGPQGERGADGTSASQITVTSESLAFETAAPTLRKVITSIIPDAVTGKFIAYRAVAGNPDAAPDRIKLTAGVDGSSWALAMPTAQAVAAAPLYLDMEPIILAIQDKYESELTRIKAGYEGIVNFWLARMSTLFDAHKQALCCAYERCISKEKSRDMRRYVETQRIQALQAGVAAQFEFDRTTGLITKAQSENCTTSNSSTSDTSSATSSTIARKGPELAAQTKVRALRPLPRTLKVDALLNSSDQRAAAIDLLPGKYHVVISDCCAHMSGAFGQLPRIFFQKASAEAELILVRSGLYGDLAQARNVYLGLSSEIDHSGGNVAAYFESMAHQDAFGSLELSFLPIIGPEHLNVAASEIPSLDTLWDKDDTPGFVVVLDNQDYIIIQKEDRWLAWPTFDRKHFIDFGEKSYRLSRNEDALKVVLKLISQGHVQLVKGNITSWGQLHSQVDDILFLEL